MIPDADASGASDPTMSGSVPPHSLASAASEVSRLMLSPAAETTGKSIRRPTGGRVGQLFHSPFSSPVGSCFLEVALVQNPDFVRFWTCNSADKYQHATEAEEHSDGVLLPEGCLQRWQVVRVQRGEHD